MKDDTTQSKSLREKTSYTTCDLRKSDGEHPLC